MTTAVDTLTAAAQVIRERGHAHDDYESPNGGVCAAGAISVVAWGRSVPPYARAGATLYQCNRYTWASNALLRWVQANTIEKSVAAWNDARTADEVIAGLLAAAKADPAYREE